MKIEKLVIDGFGKLNNCTYTFSDGLNLIFGKNESGKSTICEFLLAMFYGLPNKSKQSAGDLPARIKYKPWNSDIFGGSVYFSDDDGKKYVIERSFKATKRGDKAVLRDADTWEELGDADAIGESLFGLSQDAFLKTLYVKSFGADFIKSDDGEIMSRLSNLETSADEDVSYFEILNNLEKEIYSLKTKTGRGGKITALEDRILNLGNELSFSEMKHSELENAMKEAENLKTSSAEKEKEAKILEDKYKIALQYESYLTQKEVEKTKAVLRDRLKEETVKSKKLKEKLEKEDFDDEEKVSAEMINLARSLETKKLIAEERVNEAKAKILPDEETKILGDNRIIPAFFGLVLLLVGFFAKSIILYILGILVAVFGILVCVIINFKKKKDNDKNIEVYYEAKKELLKIDNELTEIFSLFGVTVSDELSALFVAGAEHKKSIEQLKKEYEESQIEIKKLENSLLSEADIKEFSQDAVTYSGEGSNELFEKINVLKAQSKTMSERSNEISLKVAKETAEVRLQDEIKQELKELTEEKQELEKRYSSLMRVLKWLNCAHDEIKSNFAPRLNEKASELLSYLTYEKYEDMRADDNFGINLKTDDGGIVKAEFMSRGTYDLIYIALRFASMSVLCDGKIPIVILDDAFSQLDDERLIKSAELIEKGEEFKQVFLFTCHENYKEILKGSNVIELE